MRTRFMTFVGACVAALALVVPSALGGNAATNVQIQRTAALLSPTQIAVPVGFQCPPGAPIFIFVAVSQQQLNAVNTNGSGFANAICNGSKQMITVLVNGGPFMLGPAFASASASSGADFDTDARVIQIT
jgi:hypothetical protein